MHLPDLGARPDGHAGVLVDLVDEIPGHGLVQVVAADQHVHPGNPRGEEDRRLARGVTTPDDDDGPGAAQQRLLNGGGVVHAVTLERFDSRDVEPAIPGSHGQHDGPGHHRPTVRERHPVLAAVGFQPGDLRGHQDPRSELAGLQSGPFGQVGSGDSAGETEIVLDSRRRPGLPAGCDPLHGRGGQAVRRGIHRGAQPGRTGAHHDDVGFVGHCVGYRQAHPAGQLGVGRVAQHLTAPDHHRSVRGGHARTAAAAVRPACRARGRSIGAATDFARRISRNRTVSGE